MAAAKKDFSGIKTGSRRAAAPAKQEKTATPEPQTGSRVFAAIEQATTTKGQQGTVSPAEAAERAENLQTQGRKGCKAIRINMAFSPSNHEFIKTMAKASGHTMTEFTNLVISAYRREHPEIMGQAQAFLDTINSGAFSHLLGGEENDE